jgi:hypothetical protein
MIIIPSSSKGDESMSRPRQSKIVKEWLTAGGNHLRIVVSELKDGLFFTTVEVMEYDSTGNPSWVDATQTRLARHGRWDTYVLELLVDTLGRPEWDKRKYFGEDESE